MHTFISLSQGYYCTTALTPQFSSKPTTLKLPQPTATNVGSKFLPNLATRRHQHRNQASAYWFTTTVDVIGLLINICCRLCSYIGNRGLWALQCSLGFGLWPNICYGSLSFVIGHGCLSAGLSNLQLVYVGEKTL